VDQVYDGAVHRSTYLIDLEPLGSGSMAGILWGERGIQDLIMVIDVMMDDGEALAGDR
jgi:hypothetical protein